MYNFKINKIITKNGTEIEPNQINIIIGPNNSGKSQFLKEIRNSLLSNNNNHNNKPNIIISAMMYNLPSDKNNFLMKYDLKKRVYKVSEHQYCIRNYSGLNISGLNVNDNLNNNFNTGNIHIHSGWERDLEELIESFNHRNTGIKSLDGSVISSGKYILNNVNSVLEISNPIKNNRFLLYGTMETNISDFLTTYGAIFFNYLGTEEKLLMSKTQTNYGLLDMNTNFLSQVQYNGALLGELAKYTKEMFSLDIYLDRFSWGDKILFRVGDNFDFIRESSRDDPSVEEKLSFYDKLDDEGDGMKSFVSNYLTLNMNDKDILLLDEPESFLHPPLATQFGRIIGESANETKQIFISTHSTDLLKGILSTCNNVNIIRITRNDSINNIYQLDSGKIKSIISKPLLSSAKVLNGFFCEKVYICEASADEEVYRALHDKVDLLDSALFIHGQNKQTLKDIAAIYDDLKVCNYRIYDFDILKTSDKNKDFNRALDNFLEKDIKDCFIQICMDINKCIEKDDYTNKGIRAIDDLTLLSRTNDMLEYLITKGIIILKTGCLETVFEDEGIEYTTNKNKWFEDAINYINSSEADVIGETEIFNWIYQKRNFKKIDMCSVRNNIKKEYSFS